MAAKDELITRLNQKFSNIPGINGETVSYWIDEAIEAEGFSPSQTTFAGEETRILLRARIIGVEDLALNTAHFFNFRDGEESISKGGISENYQKLLAKLNAQYAEQFGNPSAFKVMKRLDRA
ncbi:hypothetical protein LL50_05580 [Listeria monocytogenes]|nr:hypothetical protein [Listeria monocytogenes]EAD0383073.1 hypothetical protein [Listeria monocytogenes]EAD9128492.1 hypothetical protein [Listeria monocytogenes]EAE9170432.1 hypothetical protein [Listeria monocytogenes]EAF2023416.1 hypothetical protein [Listeria monocytogenes]